MGSIISSLSFLFSFGLFAASCGTKLSMKPNSNLSKSSQDQDVADNQDPDVVDSTTTVDVSTGGKNSNQSNNPPETGTGGEINITGPNPWNDDYPHKSITKETIQKGSSTNILVYLPADPVPESAPVLIYFHGWMGQTLGAELYEGMLEHIVKKGFIVGYVEYGGLFSFSENIKNASSGVKKILDYVNSTSKTKLDGDKIAYGGHSLGGVYAFAVSNQYQELGIPSPRVIIGHDPAGSGGSSPVERVASLKELPNIKPTTRVVVMPSWESMEYGGFGEAGTPYLWPALAHVPNKLFVLHKTQEKGAEKFVSDHVACITSNIPKYGSPLDDFDRYAIWTPTVATLQAEFFGQNLDWIDPSKPAIRNAGTWQDGSAREPALVNNEIDFEQMRANGKNSK